MKIRIQGQEIRYVRNTLGLTVPQFAEVLGVHPGTVHRWEGSGAKEVSVDGVAAKLLASLRLRLRQPSGFHASTLGKQITEALLIGGALVALGALINALTNEH